MMTISYMDIHVVHVYRGCVVSTKDSTCRRVGTSTSNIYIYIFSYRCTRSTDDASSSGRYCYWRWLSFVSVKDVTLVSSIYCRHLQRFPLKTLQTQEPYEYIE